MRIIHRSLLCAALLLPLLLAEARPSGSRAEARQEVDSLQSPEEAQQILETFRRQRTRGDFVFDFAFVHLPHRGQSVAWNGTMYGTWTPEGPRLRVLLEPYEREGRVLQWILWGGESPQAWRLTAEGQVETLEAGALEKPVLPGLNYTLSDLLMPYAYWQDVHYEDSRRLRGRPAHVFLLRPDEAQRVADSSIEAVEMALDADFHALLRARFLDGQGEALRTVKLNSFKQLENEDYIMKSVDLLDELTRDKTRFRIIAAQTGLRLEPSLFDPATLPYPVAVTGVQMEVL